jgi:hypothetical protein
MKRKRLKDAQNAECQSLAYGNQRCYAPAKLYVSINDKHPTCMGAHCAVKAT